MKVYLPATDGDLTRRQSYSSPMSPIQVLQQESPIERRPLPTDQAVPQYSVGNFTAPIGDSKVQDDTASTTYSIPETNLPPNYEQITHTDSQQSLTPSFYSDIPIPPRNPNRNSGAAVYSELTRPKVWSITGTSVTLSALDATVLVKAGILDYGDLQLYKAPVTLVDQGPNDPISGALSAVFGTVGTMVLRVADYPILASKVFSPTEGERPVAEFASDSSKGVTGIVGEALKAPMDITHNMARGFHNFPRLYGDRTVRTLEPITGTKSGLKVAGKGLGLGLYDGISGLVTQPVKGAKEDGALGCLKGVGKGIGGVVCKPAAGAIGLPGSTFKGIYEQVQKSRRYKTKKTRIGAQIAQGLEEWEATSEEERSFVLRGVMIELEEFRSALGQGVRMLGAEKSG